MRKSPSEMSDDSSSDSSKDEEDTGENFETVDVAVIVGLWSLKFTDSCLQTLFKHTSEVMFGSYVESNFIHWLYLCMLFGKCALMMCVAFAVDAYNHKIAVIFGSTALYSLTPGLALGMCFTQEPHFLLATVVVSAVLFVTSPAAFGLIFNQVEFPNRTQARRLVCVMEFAEGLVQAIIRETVPDKAVGSKRYPLVARWVVVLPFMICILTILEGIRRHANPDRNEENGAVEVFTGIKDDMYNKEPGSGLSKVNVLCFLFLLFPAFSVSSLTGIVSNLNPANDTQFQHPWLKNTIQISQFMVIPIYEVSLSFAPCPELMAEMAALGVVHILNFGVLLFLVLWMYKGGDSHKSPVSEFVAGFITNQSQQFLFPPTANLSAIGFATVATSKGLRESVRQLPTIFTPPLKGKLFFCVLNPTSIAVHVEDVPRNSIFPTSYNPHLAVGGHSCDYSYINFNVVREIAVWSTVPNAPPRFTRTVHFEEERFYFIALEQNENGTTMDCFIAGDDVKIPETLPKSILVIMNNLVGGNFWGTTLKEDHEVAVICDRRAVFLDTLPGRRKSLIVAVPQGNCMVTVSYHGVDPVILQQLHGTSIQFLGDIVPHTAYLVTVFVTQNSTNYFFTKLKVIAQIIPPPTTPAPTTPPPPPGPDKPHAAVLTMYVVFGLSVGVASVGYIHFFWMGCPVRLRATIFAWFIATIKISEWLAGYIIGDTISLRERVGLLNIAIFTVVWHFAFAWYYERKIMPEELERRRSSSDTPSN